MIVLAVASFVAVMFQHPGNKHENNCLYSTTNINKDNAISSIDALTI